MESVKSFKKKPKKVLKSKISKKKSRVDGKILKKGIKKEKSTMSTQSIST